jgi:hypothetical protein
MNVALCLSGQNRSEYFNYDFLNYIKNYERLDVFCHFWSDKINNEFLEKFKPKKFTFEASKKFEDESLFFCRPFMKIDDAFKKFNSDLVDWNWEISQKKKISHRILFGKNHDLTQDINKILFNIHKFSVDIHSMYYSIYYSNVLKNLYEAENKIKYDVIIRARPDIFLETEIDLSKINLLYLNTPKTTRYINDMFAISNKENMDIYCSTFLHLKNILYQIYKNDSIDYLTNETFLYQNLISQNVKINVLDNTTKINR